jgi:hypothetical protein
MSLDEDMSLSILSSVVVVVVMAAGCNSAHPDLRAMGGRHISLYTELRRNPDLIINSSTLLVDTNEISICLSHFHNLRLVKSVSTSSTCVGSIHKNIISEFNTTSCAISCIVTMFGKRSCSIVDLDTERLVMDIDDNCIPLLARYVVCSGFASPIIMEDAIVPHPIKPACIGRSSVVVGIKSFDC